MWSSENQPKNILHVHTHRAYAEDWKGARGEGWVKKDREGLGHNTEEVLNCQRERLWGKMSLGIWERDIAVAMLPHEAIIYKIAY